MVDATNATRTFVWGSGGAGQLGLGNRDDYTVPQELQSQALVRETVTTAGCHSVGWTEQGELYVWGDNEKHQLARSREVPCLTAPTPLLEVHDYEVQAAACGWSHTLMVVTKRGDGQEPSYVLSWGAREHHQLGRDVSEAHPNEAPWPISLPCLARERRVQSLSCGWKHSVLVLDDGAVYSWGSGRHGELALGKSQLTAHEPTLVTALAGSSIDQVFCGWQHSAFFSSTSGALFSSGNNRHGQLGVPTTAESARFLPAHVLDASGEPLRAAQIAVGWHFILCLAVDGALVSWGKGTHGQLGLGSFETVEVPTVVRFDDRVASIACGSEHAMVVTLDGDLFTCGWGEHGNLGHGDTENRSVLSKVPFFRDHNWRVVAATAGGAVSIAHVCPRSIDVDLA